MVEVERKIDSYGHQINLMGFREWIIPQDKVFFNLLEEQAELVLKAAELFKEMINNYDSFGLKMKRMHSLEHEGDEIVHKIFQKLNRTFIAPIDHEDISSLASLYDDVLDYIDGVANRIFLFKLKPNSGIKDFANIITKQVKEINDALPFAHSETNINE